MVSSLDYICPLFEGNYNSLDKLRERQKIPPGKYQIGFKVHEMPTGAIDFEPKTFVILAEVNSPIGFKQLRYNLANLVRYKTEPGKFINDTVNAICFKLDKNVKSTYRLDDFR
jgi:hypothetical protein